MQESEQKKFSDLLDLFDTIQRKLNNFVIEGGEQLQKIERRVRDLEDGVIKKQEIENLARDLETIRRQIGTMESGLISEFRVSQEIMKNMIEHDMSIEKAKFDFKMQLDKQKQDLEIQSKKNRQELTKKLVIQIGVIVTPIVSAITAFVVHLINN